MARIPEMVNEAIRRDFENDLRLDRQPEDVFLTAETQSKAGAEEEEERAAFTEKLLLNDQREDDGPVLIALIWSLLKVSFMLLNLYFFFVFVITEKNPFVVVKETTYLLSPGIKAEFVLK